jgi:sulfonate transport system permease protein
MRILRRLQKVFNPAGILVVLAMLGLWQLVVDSGLISLQFLPAPTGVATGVREVLASGELGGQLSHTVGNVLISWVIAVACGLVLGFALGLSELAWNWSMASVEVLRAVPVIALVPVALLIFGLSSTTEIIVAAYASVWPVLISTASGARATPARLFDVADTFAFGRVARLRKIVIPVAVPAILIGVRLALTISLVIVILTEMLGPPLGMGYAVIEQQRALQTDQMWAYVVLIGLLGVVLNGVFNGIVRWRLRGFAPLLEARGS